MADDTTTKDGVQDTPPYYELECACGVGALVAAPDGYFFDGAGVECPGCGHEIAMSCGGYSAPEWYVHYDKHTSNAVLATHYEGPPPEGCELLEAT